MGKARGEKKRDEGLGASKKQEGGQGGNDWKFEIQDSRTPEYQIQENRKGPNKS
jgi:hypothetical protein